MTRYLKAVYSRLPLVREIHDLRDEIWRQSGVAGATLRCLQQIYIAQLLRDSRYADPRHLNRFERQVFSQHGEDGITAEILSRIGTTNKFFVEIGAGDGLENNTGYLLSQGWRGAWVEADADRVREIRKHLRSLLDRQSLTLVDAFATRENIIDHLASAGAPHEFDVLSIDVDQNTFWIWEGLSSIRPRVVVVEYNASWPPGVDWKVHYDPQNVWDLTFAYGASLTAFERLAAELGYRLVACDLTGTNAFFVRADLVLDHFVGPFDARTHYHPPSYFLNHDVAYPRGFGSYRGTVSDADSGKGR
jgi:hypothetical protein